MLNLEFESGFFTTPLSGMSLVWDIFKSDGLVYDERLGSKPDVSICLWEGKHKLAHD